jgi:hypothetical protein
MLLALVVGLGSLGWSWFGDGSPRIQVPSLQIEVLNACGEPGLANRAAQRLQRLGHDVVGIGDAPGTTLERSIIVDRRGRDRLSRALARQIGPCPVVLERTPDPEADLTLFLGADWSDLRLFSPSGPV